MRRNVLVCRVGNTGVQCSATRINATSCQNFVINRRFRMLMFRTNRDSVITLHANNLLLKFATLLIVPATNIL